MLKKAKIYVENSSAKDGYACSFNPAEYTIRNSSDYKENTVMGSQKETLSYTYTNLREFSATLYFASTVDFVELYKDSSLDTASAVTDQTGPIVNAMNIDGHTHKPPDVAFVWGNLNFAGVFTTVTETFTLFSSSGKPIRAKLDITIKEKIDSSLNKKGTPLFSPDRSKSITLTQGMSLWAMAYEEYGDPELWRLIAQANGIKNPLHLENGRVLKLPAL